MNLAALAAAERGLTSICRKVLEATPSVDAWSTAQIVGEMRRRGQNSEYKVIAGCLASLKDDGLVREPKLGHFIRRTVKPKPELVSSQPHQTQTEDPPVPTTTKTAPVATNATEAVAPPKDLGAIAGRLRGLGKLANDIADAIDDAAIEIETRTEALNKDLEKLRQLQQLLKNIGG